MENDSTQADGNKLRTINIKTVIIIAVVIAIVFVIAALAYVYKGLFVAAMVNGSPISRFTVIGQLEKVSGKQTLDALITKKLIGDEARKKGISVSAEEINAQLKNIEANISAQGNTLDAALAAQGMSMDDLREQIMLQKEVEKLLADKVNVTDGDVEQYIKDNKIAVPEGQEVEYQSQIKEQLKSQKFSQEAKSFVDSLRSQAKISYFVNY